MLEFFKVRSLIYINELLTGLSISPKVLTNVTYGFFDNDMTPSANDLIKFNGIYQWKMGFNPDPSKLLSCKLHAISFIYLLIYLFVYLFIYPFIHLFFIYSFIYLFIYFYLFIYLFCKIKKPNDLDLVFNNNQDLRYVFTISVYNYLDDH